MPIHPTAAREYWKNRVWYPSEYENKSCEIEKLVNLAHNNLNGNSTIVELGCGIGDFTKRFLKSSDNNLSYYCVDVNKESLDLLVQNVKYDINTICGYFGEDDISEQLPKEADAVLCSRALMHFPDTDNFMSKVSRLLKKGGLLIADTLPKSSRMTFLKEKYGNKAYGIELAYILGNCLAGIKIGSGFLTRSGLLRTINPNINELKESIRNNNMGFVYGELDPHNHYYRFISKKT